MANCCVDAYQPRSKFRTRSISVVRLGVCLASLVPFHVSTCAFIHFPQSTTNDTEFACYTLSFWFSILFTSFFTPASLTSLSNERTPVKHITTIFDCGSQRYDWYLSWLRFMRLVLCHVFSSNLTYLHLFISRQWRPRCNWPSVFSLS